MSTQISQGNPQGKLGLILGNGSPVSLQTGCGGPFLSCPSLHLSKQGRSIGGRDFTNSSFYSEVCIVVSLDRKTEVAGLPLSVFPTPSVEGVALISLFLTAQ